MTDVTNNERQREGHIFKPLPIWKPIYKVEIKYAGDTTYTDISSYCYRVSFSHNSRDRLSSGSMDIEDPYADFYQLVQGGEWIRVWAGYTTATYLEFTGRVVRKQLDFQPTTGYLLSIDMRAWPELGSKKLSFTFDDELVEGAIGQILAQFSYISFTAPGITTDRISRRFVSNSAMAMIREIVTVYGLEFFVDAYGVAHLFYAEDNKIQHDAVVLNQNLLTLTELGVDMDRMANHVKIFGKQENTVTWLRSAWDDANIAQYWQMDEEIFDSALLTNDSAISRAEKELDYRKQLLEEGRIVCMGMENIMPGKMIYCAIPPVVNEWKTIRTVSHEFSEEGWLTNFSIEFDSLNMTSTLLERDKKIKGLQGIPLEKIYDETIVIDPANDSDYIILTGLSIENSKIVCTATAPSTGSFSMRTSFPAMTLSKEVVSAVVVVDGENLQKSTFYVSNDAGLSEQSFENTELGTEQKVFTTINDNIRIRGTLVDVDSDNEVIINRIAVFFRFE